jgi:hypothetical protein
MGGDLLDVYFVHDRKLHIQSPDAVQSTDRQKIWLGYEGYTHEEYNKRTVVF